MNKPVPVALVTGAAGGIGSVCARLLAERGFRVIGTSRDPRAVPKDRLLEGIEYRRLELTDSESIRSLCESLERVDLLISNAGVSQIGAVEDLTDSVLEQVMQTNFAGAVRLDREIASLMRNGGGGQIVHVSSLAARIPVPYSSIYAASKAALDAYSAALSHELRPFNIPVTNVFFDFVATPLPQLGELPDTSSHTPFVKRAKQMRDRSISRGMDPEYVGRQIVRAALRKHPKGFVPIGLRTRGYCIAVRLLPSCVIQYAIGRIFTPRR